MIEARRGVVGEGGRWVLFDEMVGSSGGVIGGPTSHCTRNTLSSLFLSPPLSPHLPLYLMPARATLVDVELSQDDVLDHFSHSVALSRMHWRLYTELRFSLIS